MCSESNEAFTQDKWCNLVKCWQECTFLWGINESSNSSSAGSINRTENSIIYGSKMSSLTPTIISTSNPCEAEIKQKI